MSSQGNCAAAEALGIQCDSEVQLLPIDSFQDTRGQHSVRTALFGDNQTRQFNICTQHFRALSHRLRKKCVTMHPGGRTTNLHAITLDEYVHSSKQSDVSPELKCFVLEPNKELCQPCYEEYLTHFKTVEESLPSDTTSDTDASGSNFSPVKRPRFDNPKDTAIAEFDELLAAMNIAPLAEYFKKQNNERQAQILREKLDQIWTVALKRAGNVSAIVEQEGFSVDQARTAVKEVKEITAKMKRHIADDGIPMELKIQLASLCPKDWSERSIRDEIGVSRYIARLGKQLRTFGDNLPHTRVTKSEVLKNKIVDFWRRPDISRELAGKKDYRRVRMADGGWEKLQKRLLYVTYSEAYETFTGSGKPRERELGEVLPYHEDEELVQLLVEENLSISTFVKYKPPEVVPMSRRRQHNVCVCRYHENARLICERIGLPNMSSLMELLVCSSNEGFRKDCMYLRCPGCEDNSIVLEEYVYSHLNGKNMLERDFTIQQWERTDATGIVTHCVSGGDYPNFLAQKLRDLLKHHYVTKEQNDFFEKTKKDLDEGSGIVVVDFAENFAPTYQNEISAMHFGGYRTKGQTTLHPIALYIRRGDKLECKSFCVITDYMDHTQNAVHSFIGVFLDHVTSKYPQITRFKFFSDGCAGQYKSVKAFKNIAMFSKDYPGLQITWSYFATSHGKNVCDGIGGYMKRCASDDVLRESVIIRNGKDLYDYIIRKIPTLTCFYLDKAQVHEHIKSKKLNERYEKLESVHGTLGIHHVVPWEDNCGVDLFEVGRDTLPFTRHRFGTEPLCVTDDFLGKSVACVYQDKWYIGEVYSIDPEEEEAFVKFFRKPTKVGKMQRGGQGDECFVPFGRFLARVEVTEETTGRSWKLQGDASKVMADLDNKLEEFLRRQ